MAKLIELNGHLDAGDALGVGTRAGFVQGASGHAAEAGMTRLRSPDGHDETPLDRKTGAVF